MGDLGYVYRDELNKVFFQHNTACGDFKDLPRRTASDKILCDKAFDIAKNPKYDGYSKYDRYQRGLASMVYRFFDKTFFSGGGIKNENTTNQELAEEFHQPNIR